MWRVGTRCLRWIFIELGKGFFFFGNDRVGWFVAGGFWIGGGLLGGGGVQSRARGRKDVLYNIIEELSFGVAFGVRDDGYRTVYRSKS